jgi:hypothetical protein
MIFNKVLRISMSLVDVVNEFTDRFKKEFSDVDSEIIADCSEILENILSRYNIFTTLRPSVSSSSSCSSEFIKRIEQKYDIEAGSTDLILKILNEVFSTIHLTHTKNSLRPGVKYKVVDLFDNCGKYYIVHECYSNGVVTSTCVYFEEFEFGKMLTEIDRIMKEAGGVEQIEESDYYNCAYDRDKHYFYFNMGSSDFYMSFSTNTLSSEETQQIITKMKKQYKVKLREEF